MELLQISLYDCYFFDSFVRMPTTAFSCQKGSIQGESEIHSLMISISEFIVLGFYFKD